MRESLAEFVSVAFFDPTTAKHAFVVAVLAASLWTFVAKPLAGGFPSLIKRAREALSAKKMNAVNSNHVQKDTGSRSTNAKKKQGAVEVLPNTHEALQELYQSPRFASWYEHNRLSILERVRLRCAQRVWASLAMMVVLLLAVFVLPFFSFANADTALLGLLRSGSGSGGGGGERGVCLACLEPLLQLVALATLFTTTFMPGDAKPTAMAMLAAVQELFTLPPWQVDDDDKQSITALTSPLQKTSVTVCRPVLLRRKTVDFTKAHLAAEDVRFVK